MSKPEMVTGELNDLPEHDMDQLLGYIRSLKKSRVESAALLEMAESSLAKDWLTASEDEAWASL